MSLPLLEVGVGASTLIVLVAVYDTVEYEYEYVALGDRSIVTGVRDGSDEFVDCDTARVASRTGSERMRNIVRVTVGGVS